jgi:hypothetical protein
MLTIPAPQFRRRRGRIKSEAQQTPAALALVQAVYDSVNRTLRLRFNQTINIAGINTGVIFVYDGNTNHVQYDGTGGNPILNDPQTVTIILSELFSDSNPGVFLSANSGNGIVATGGGNAWAGAVNVTLPFP